jgi:predicted nucleotidyltransferase
MSQIFHQDFIDFLKALNEHDVKYILVGGYAVILHGYERVTGDMDTWVESTTDNYERLYKAFITFGMPVFDMSLNNFLDTEKFDVFRFGRDPVAIDIMTKVKGLIFDEVFDQSEIRVIDGIPVRVIHYHHLVEAKTQSGRNKDLNDLDNLRKTQL